MSFGFGPSDFVGIINFASKVIKSLSERGGAKAEYQEAELQCRSFIEIMDEIKALDLSSLPKASRDKIEVHSSHVHKALGTFKEQIAKYERAMGKATIQNRFSSAPRRIQWALCAADDLAKFRQSLAPLISIINFEISLSTFVLVSRDMKTLIATLNSQSESSAFATETPGAPSRPITFDCRRHVTEYLQYLESDTTSLSYHCPMLGNEAFLRSGVPFGLSASIDGPATSPPREVSQPSVSPRIVDNVKNASSPKLSWRSESSKSNIQHSSGLLLLKVNGDSNEKNLMSHATDSNHEYKPEDPQRLEVYGGNNVIAAYQPTNQNPPWSQGLAAIDPLNFDYPILAAIFATGQAAQSLCMAVKRYRGRHSAIQRVQGSVEDLVNILDSLKSLICSEAPRFAALQLIVEQCGKLCSNFEEDLESFNAVSMLSLHNRAIRFNRCEIQEFIDLITGRASTISPNALVAYIKLREDTEFKLETNLRRINEKIAHLYSRRIQ